MPQKLSRVSAALLMLVLSACLRPAPAPGHLTPASKSQAAAATNAAPVPTSFPCTSIGTAVDDDVERVCVPYAGTPKGDAQALITVVVFSDFECPYCSRVQATLSKLEQTYPGKLRFYFRHEPLPFHGKARLAAQAAVAAENQGRFWPMHDRLFAHQSELRRQDLIQHAQALGLEPERFVKDLEAPETRARIDEDVKLANALGVQGTPNFFINGRNIRGAVPFEEFQKVIDDELLRAQKMGPQAASGYSLYAAMMDGKGKGLGTLTKNVLDKAPAKQEEVRPGEPQPGQAYKVDIKGAPTKGAKDALVTIVEYADFQCPFCTRVEETLDQLLKDYSGKVRLVWRNLPLAFHADAKRTAIAAMAAERQGKFWEMHHALLQNQAELGDEAIERYAKELKLDLVKFKAALADDKISKAIDEEVVAAGKIGVRATPCFFINGVFLAGAQPLERFKERIDEALVKANALVKKGTPKAKVYDQIMKSAVAEVAEPAAQR